MQSCAIARSYQRAYKSALHTRLQTRSDFTASGLEYQLTPMSVHPRQHYRAERMCLAVLGGQSLEQLQEMVVALFGSLPIEIGRAHV